MTTLQLFQEKINASPDGRFGPETFHKGAEYFDLNPIEAAHFFAQCSHESSEFTRFEENLNYSAIGLVKTFPKYFDLGLANHYERKPEKIANLVYANRMGNGDMKSGDGWRYRGRGAIQLTGKENYQNFAQFMGVEIKPEEISEKYAFDSAYWFFMENKLFTITRDLYVSTVKRLTFRINGGFNGLEDRIDLTEKYEKFIL